MVDINVRCSGVGELVQWELPVVDINVRWGRRAGTVGALSGRYQRKVGGRAGTVGAPSGRYQRKVG